VEKIAMKPLFYSFLVFSWIWVGSMTFANLPANAEDNLTSLEDDTINLLNQVNRTPQSEMSAVPKENVKIVYPRKTELDLDAMQIQGELKNPGDFYFQVKPEDKMDSLVKRRKNFHRQMLRDVMFSK